MYRIKQTPEDFIVEEGLDLSNVVPSSDKKFLIYKLRKSNTSTLLAIRLLAQKLDIEEKLIGFCGLKDKNATTSQYISLPNFGGKTGKERLQSLDIPNIVLEFIGSCDKPLFIGALAANRFTIRVSGISGYSITEQKAMVNYFGEQRFSDNNANVGRHIVKREFAKARDLIIQTSGDDSSLREFIAYAQRTPSDPIGALRKLSPQLLSLYVHAFQSAIWNRVASDLVKKHESSFQDDDLAVAIPKSLANLPQIGIPLLGFDYEAQRYTTEVQGLISAELKNEGLSARDFIIRELPQLTKTGNTRTFLSPIHDLSIKRISEDEAIVSFTLEKGSYATVALRHLLIPVNGKT